MKTMMSLDGAQIVRVSDEKASRLYSDGYKYIAKSIWKEKVRDVNKEPEVNEDTGGSATYSDLSEREVFKPYLEKE